MSLMGEKKKGSYSKIIVGGLGAIAVTVTAFTMYMVKITGDLTPLPDLIQAVFAALAIGFGFYFTKAKAENLLKLRKQYGAEIYNDVKEDIPE